MCLVLACFTFALQNVLSDAKLKKTEVSEIVLVGGSTRIPKVQQLLKEFFDGKEPNRGINPDEAIAYGAAVQAGMISGADNTDEIVLLDVIPLTVTRRASCCSSSHTRAQLGIETEGGVMEAVVNRNSMVPTKKSKTFTTTQDDQEVCFTVFVWKGVFQAFLVGGVPRVRGRAGHVQG